MVATLRDVGEFGLIARLRSLLAASQRGMVVGIGDDAAAWTQPEAVLVASTDMLVEGIHFDLALTGWEDLGWKALAVNLSDVAAMGARPDWAFVSVGLRADTAVEDVVSLYTGMRRLADEHGCILAGGDTVSVRRDAVLNVAVLGSVPAGEQEHLLRRDRGRPGDLVAVTGHLGASAAGLFALQHPEAVPVGAPAARAALVAAHRRPQPRLAAGQALRRTGVRCAMDVSDGLMADVAKLCAESGCGAVVELDRLPVHPAVREAFPERALEWAAGGGEDYELLFAAPPRTMRAAVAALAAAGAGAATVGRLTERAQGIRVVDSQGRNVPQERAGWDHFQ